MVSSNYLSSRKRWSRPQAVILSNNSNGIFNGVPQIDGLEGEDFLILSDHNRSEISIALNRIENRKRMANGHLRSYHIADKVSVSMSWSMLPSRSHSGKAAFYDTGDQETDGKIINTLLTEYTADGGAGGADLLKWYKNNTGSFFMFLAYDNPNAFIGDTAYNQENLYLYSDVVEVFFTSFDYKVVKRGQSNHDLWNISASFEEV